MILNKTSSHHDDTYNLMFKTPARPTQTRALRADKTLFSAVLHQTVSYLPKNLLEITVDLKENL